MLFDLFILLAIFLALSAIGVLSVAVRRPHGRWAAFLFGIFLGLENLGIAAAEDPSSMEVIEQVEANQAEFDNLYLKIETTSEEQGTNSVSQSPAQAIEFWVFDGDDGHRKLKLFNQGRLPFMYMIDLTNLNVSTLTMGGKIKDVPIPPEVKQSLEKMLEGAMQPVSTFDSEQFVVERAPEADSDGAGLPAGIVREGEEDRAGMEISSQGMKKGRKSKIRRASIGLFDRLAKGTKGKRFRQKLKPWKGKRVRALRMRPVAGSETDRAFKREKGGVAVIEKQIDMATGLVVEEKQLTADGKVLSRTKVDTFKTRIDGVTVPERMFRESHKNGKIHRMNTRFVANEVNKNLRPEEKALAIPENLRPHP